MGWREDVQRRDVLDREVQAMDLTDRKTHARFDALYEEDRRLAKRAEMDAARDAVRNGRPDVEPDAEAREWSKLVRGVGLGEYARSAMAERGLSGRALEMNEELGLESAALGSHLGGVAVPMGLLLESRADAATALASGGAPESVSFSGRVFRTPLARFFAIHQPMVPAGESKWVVISDGPTAAEKSPGAATDATAVTHSVTTFTPKRVTSRVVMRDEDALRNPGWEMALQDDLSASVSHGIDEETLKDVVGALTATDDSTTISASGMAAKVSGLVDGVYAGEESDIRVLLGLDSFGVLAGKIYTNTAVTGVDVLRRLRVAFRVVPVGIVAAKDSDNKQTMPVRLGARELDAAAPIWSAGRLVRDPYSKSDAAEVGLTMHAFYGGCSILRAGGFSLETLKLA